jgi:outer membrane protein OmpA-like peptidoglycan-associated protein
MPSPKPFAPFRRVSSALLLLFAAVLLAACASRPATPPQSLRAQQEAILRDHGFVEVEDGWLMTIAEPISFEFDRSELRASLRGELLDAARNLRAVRIEEVRCEGHTDNLGAYEYNATLSLARGRAVADVFVEAGFAPERVAAVGLASDFPVESNETREGRAANRRVAIIVPAQSLATD